MRLAAVAITKRFMSVKIRMKRIGAKNTPVFRIVVADGRSPRDGMSIEEIGTYQPLKKGENYTLNLDRANYWVSKGAQPSDTVASFIRKAKKATAAVQAQIGGTPFRMTASISTPAMRVIKRAWPKTNPSLPKRVCTS